MYVYIYVIYMIMIMIMMMMMIYIYIHMYHTSNMAMENPRFIDGIPIKPSIYRGFSIARFEHEPCRMTVEQRN